MATITTGYTFSSGEKNITHTKLNNAINLATITGIGTSDLSATSITKALLNSSVAGLGLELGADNSLQIVGHGFTTTALTNANQTLTRSTSTRTQKYTGILTGAVVINISRTNAIAGDRFRIVLGGITVTASLTLTIQENGSGSLLVFSDASAPVVRGSLEAEFNGTSWELTFTNTQESAT